MKKGFFIRWMIVFLAIAGSNNVLIAGQYMGGEILYEISSKGNVVNTYKITYRINRNCRSYAEFDPPVIWFFNSMNGIPHTKGFKLSPTLFSKKRLNGIKVDDCAMNLPETCNDLYEFVGYIDLPNDSNGYLVYASDCCRNDHKNLEGESWNRGTEIVAGIPELGYALTYYTRIPGNGIVAFNSSPIPTTDSIMGACVGKPFQFKLNYNDIDGDELRFYFGDPIGKTDLGISQIRTLNYFAGADNQNPLGAAGNITLNPLTGTIVGKSNQAGNFIIVVDIQEWRNGVLINTHRKEVELNIVECRAKLPAPPISCENPIVYFGNHYNDPTLKYQWDFGVQGIDSDTSSQINPIYKFPNAGQFKVQLILTNANNCKDTVGATIGVYPDLKADFDWAEPICNGMPLLLRNKSVFPSGNITSYRWNFTTSRNGSQVFSRDKDPYFNYTYTDSVPLAYSIQLNITTDKGCNAVINKAPIIYPRPDAFVGVDTTISFDNPYEIPLKTSTQNSYLWTPTNGLSNPRIANPLVTGGVSQCYQLKVWGKDSLCTNTDNICISYSKGPDVYVPTAFTPNGDGLNDRISFKAVQVEVEEFVILDRWGQPIFKSKSSSQSWDGRIKGIKPDSNVFVWVVKGKGPGNKPFVKSGTILLLR